MSTSDIEDQIRDIYGLDISDTTVSRITDKVLPAAKEWQMRPTALTIGLIIRSFIALFYVYTKFGIDSRIYSDIRRTASDNGCAAVASLSS